MLSSTAFALAAHTVHLRGIFSIHPLFSIHPQATGHGCAPYHPQTQGKIERWHQTLKNRILLENYFLPGDLEAQIEAFVDHYNHQRYHESINNVTPADVYFGRDKAILKQRERIKRKTLEARRLHHRQHAA